MDWETLRTMMLRDSSSAVCCAIACPSSCRWRKFLGDSKVRKSRSRSGGAALLTVRPFWRIRGSSGLFCVGGKMDFGDLLECSVKWRADALNSWARARDAGLCNIAPMDEEDNMMCLPL